MPWYRAGSVAVTNGSAIVTGAGTDFVGNTQAGEVFLGPDGRVYEISGIVSATQLTIIPNYQGASAAGQAYGIQPTASFARDLALGAAQLLNTFAAVRDGVGQGLFPDGTVTTPAMRFAADQDTGIRRLGPNILSLVTGGVDQLVIDAAGRVGLGGSGPQLLFVNGPSATDNVRDTYQIGIAANGGVGLSLGSGTQAYVQSWSRPLSLNPQGNDVVIGAVGGNLLVGMSGASTGHRIRKTISQGGEILRIDDGTYDALIAFACGAYGYSVAGTAIALGRNTTTNRSINAGGTVNASGADYAEYMLKAAGCGMIAKGDVCGVDRHGKLTRTWADAISFVIKSTDPSLVGGDTWAAHLAPKPEQPGAEPQTPILPAAPADEADMASMAAWIEAQNAYPALLAAYRAEHTAWQQAMDAYAADLAAWEDELETARQCVDRVAFCGQVPCNVTGDFEVGDYIIAAAAGAGIKAIAVKADAMTLPQYTRRIGKVWAIRDGRAWIDVQHG